MTAEAFVEIRDVVFRRDHRVIYDGLTASVPRGKITAIVGPSGTGKTTLLRLIGGQLKPESGDVSVDGLSVQSLKRSASVRSQEADGDAVSVGSSICRIQRF